MTSSAHVFVASSISSDSLPAFIRCGIANPITVSISAALIYSLFIHFNFGGSKTAADVDKRSGSKISINVFLPKISSSPTGDQPSNVIKLRSEERRVGKERRDT